MRKVMVCSDALRKDILFHNDSFQTTKYMSKKEFMDHYFFSYDERAISYLMKKYQYPIDVCKVYLEHLYVIEDKEYSTTKLCFLRDLKKELIEEGLLYFHDAFKAYIQDAELSISHLYHLDLYEEKALQHSVEVEDVSLDFPVYEFSTMEEEIHFVCCKIRELLKEGVTLSNIVLTNVTEDYYYSLEKMFSYYQIPIMIPYSYSIYSTKIVQDYLKTRELDLEHPNPITKKICSILSDLVELEDDSIKEEIFIDRLKHTRIDSPIYEEAVSIEDFYESVFSENQYVFVLGFNQDQLPRIVKDIDLFSDIEKEEVGEYPSDYINYREKRVVASILAHIPHKYVSYKKMSPFQKYYPSSMIDEYGLKIEKYDEVDCCYSSIYNQLRLGKMLDEYYTYGEIHPSMSLFQKYYSLPYNEYDSSFKGIDKDLYLKNLDYPLRISYTSMNAYNECPFKYYCQYVLKLGHFEDTFASYIGSLYHKILSLYQKNPFDFEREWNLYLEKRDLSLKETVLLLRIKKDLEELIQVLKEQELITGFDNAYYERELKVTVRDDIFVEFVGYVDKIMFYQKVNDTYFSIIDYKTGMIDTHIEPMKYGLHMQLPIYLYLISYSNVFDNPIFTGIYYQNILFQYPSWSFQVEEEKKDFYKLKGYSTEHVETLSRFDSTYQDSNYIKGLKYDEEKGFNRFSKILSDEMIYNIIQYTKKEIEKDVQCILNGDFSIQPKVYGKENISCKYCQYKDICYMRDSDLEYLEKVEDFSFLGGEE